MLSLSVIHLDGEIVAQKTGEEPYLAFKDYEYVCGDVIELVVDTVPGYYFVQFDETLPESLVYLTEAVFRYTVILDESLRRSFSPKIFRGKRHYVRARKATEEEIARRRNLALNPHDQKEITGAYPHALANVETRNDSTFFARNAIDGMVANDNHGSFPYQSWGINRQTDAELTVDFGREVLLDQLVLVLRGDYPHDSYWTEITVVFSDDSTEIIYPTNTLDRQRFDLPNIKTHWIKLTKLVKNMDESPFPALTELEVYGFESISTKDGTKLAN